MASQPILVCVLLLFIVEAVFGNDAFFESYIAPIVPMFPAVPFFKNVNLRIFLGVFIVFLLSDV